MGKKVIMNSLAVVCMMFLMCSMHANASSAIKKTVTVGTNCKYTTAVSGATRTGNYSYVNVKAHSVCPSGTYTTDNFTKCKTKLYKNDSTGTAISSSYTLTEGSSYTNVYIKEGCLSLKSFKLAFAGNNSEYGAVIVYSYCGM